MKYHHRRSLVGLLLTIAMLAAALPAALADAPQGKTVQTKFWLTENDSHQSIFVEQVEASFLSEQGRQLFPILYQGSVYIPLKTAGEWLGADVSWDKSRDAVTLTTGKTPFYLDFRSKGGQAKMEEEFKQYQKDKYEGFEIQTYPSLTITLDGKTVSLANANGEALVPILFRENIYLPVRTVGELCGKNVLWRQGNGIDPVDSQIWIYDSPTAEQWKEIWAYQDACRDVSLRLDDLLTELSGLTSAERERIGQCLKEMKALSDSLSTISVPQVPFFQGHFLTTARFYAFELGSELNTYIYIHENRPDRTWEQERDWNLSWLEKETGKLSDSLHADERLLNLMHQYATAPAA